MTSRLLAKWSRRISDTYEPMEVPRNEPIGHAAQDGMDFGIDIHFGVGAHNAYRRNLAVYFLAFLGGSDLNVSGRIHVYGYKW